MRFGILGPLEVSDDQGRRLGLAAPKQRAVLAILLLHANDVVSSERLVEDLWGDRAPSSAAKSLQVHVSRLRGALRDGRSRSEERLVTVPGGYLLRVAPGELDAHCFERMIGEGEGLARVGSWEPAAERLREALGLWRGRPLSDFAYESFAQAEIARLSELQVGAVEQRIAAEIALGREAQVIGELERLVREHPYRERFRCQLMLALYRTDRQAEALATYRDARSVLVEELGIEPSLVLKELHEAILAQDPSLDPTVARREQPTDSVFVGYRRELGVLEAALGRTVAGAGGVVLIAGEPGIGKSTLASRLAEVARARSARALWGRCWEAGGAPAYWPWVQALRAYLADCPADEAREHLGSAASELAEILPEIRDLLPGAINAGLAESEDGRFRLFEAIAAFVRRAAIAQPLVFILDDLHAADEPSLLLLRFLLDRAAGLPVLIVGAYRDTDTTEEHPLRAMISELTRQGVGERLLLRGFDPDETARLLALNAPTGNALPVLAAAIHRSSSGNPLLVTELVRLLDAEGRLEELADPDALELPEGVNDVIERWLQRLSPECRHTLSVAAVIGREFDVATLAQARARLARELVGDLDAAIAVRLVSDAPGGRGHLRFSHDLVREALYRKLSGVRRAQLHEAVAEALERLYARNIGAHLSELAHHYVNATATGDARKAIGYARLAADHAASLLAYEEAVRLYALALDTLEQQGGELGEERGELLLEIADQLALAGDVGRARPALARAEREADRLGSAPLRARVAVTRGELDILAGDDVFLHISERMLSAIETFHSRGDVLHEARAWWVISFCNHGVGREVAAGDAAERMLVCARQAGSRALEDKALHRIACSVATGPTPVAQAIPRLSRMLAETDSPYVRSKVLMYLAELEAMNGRYREARELARQSTTLMAQLNDVRELALGEALRCSAIELWAGDFVASERFARSGCEVLERLGASGYLTSLLICIVEALLPQGRRQEAIEVLATAESLLVDQLDLDAIQRQARARAMIELDSGDPIAAEHAARVAVETSLQADMVCEHASNWLVLADSLRALGREADARGAARQALAIAERKGHALYASRARRILDAQ